MKKRKIFVLGAGISGLSCAYFIRKRFSSSICLKVLEKSQRSGGTIRSERIEGHLFEYGARGLRPNSSALESLELMEHLGLEDQLIGASKKMKRRFLYLQGSLQEISLNPWRLFSSSLFKGTKRAILAEIFKSKKLFDCDESIDAFARRRFNAAVAEKFFDPMARGIYGASSCQLSLRACFPKLATWEKEYGSCWKGFFLSRNEKTMQSSFVSACRSFPLVSLKEGMERLPRSLEKALKEDLFFGDSVLSIEPKEGKLQIHTKRKSFLADLVISTLAAKDLAPVLSQSLPEISRQMHLWESQSLVLVHLLYPRDVLKKEGFGYLVPSSEKDPAMGGVFNSCVFPQQLEKKGQSFTLMLHYKEGLEEKHYRQMALKSMKKHLACACLPKFMKVSILKDAISRYCPGHLDRVKKIEGELTRHLKGFFLAGSSFYGVAVNDCIAHAKKLAYSLSFSDLNG